MSDINSQQMTGDSHRRSKDFDALYVAANSDDRFSVIILNL